MPSSIAELEAQALKLSPEDRVRLANRLLSSLTANADVEDAWSAEVDQRITDWESGSIQGIAVESALARAHAAIR